MSISRELALTGSWSGHLVPTCNSRPWEGSTPTAMVAPHGIPTIDEAKRQARRMAFARRAGDPGAAGLALLRHLLPYLLEGEAALPPGALVGGVWPLPGEIDLRPLLMALLDHGHGIALPVTPPRGQPLAFRRWRPGEALAEGPMGTRHPATGAPVAPHLLLVPLLAFDRAGRRLGYGGGYYDRTLAALPGCRAIGFGFAVQEMPAVPAGPHDVRLPLIATDSGLIACDP